MKFLKKFKSFPKPQSVETKSIYDNYEQVKEEVNDIKGILRELIDDFWYVKVEFVPKRWEESYKSDIISIRVKKKNCKPGDLYHRDYEFKMHEIEEVKRILNIYYENDIKIKICLPGEPYDSYLRLTGDPIRDENGFMSSYTDISNVSSGWFYGEWKNITKEELENYFKNNESIFGIYLFINLGTKDIDLQS